jgi:PAS domain S-box-containing protein
MESRLPEQELDFVPALSRYQELEERHRRTIEQLRQANEALAKSEERFLDLFDEAPIAYVHEGLDTRIIRANRAAMSLLGLAPAEVAGTYGKSLVPETPEAQQRVRLALASVRDGTDVSGATLELRRKDNGKPVLIEWWSKPDADGLYTRTMFIDITERMLMAQNISRIEAQNSYLKEEILGEQNFGDIVGRFPGLQNVLRQIALVAPTDANVLVVGESGTGKELIARAIHERSPRRQGPLIKVNCGAVLENLFESEMFGHVRGAFTGAVKDRLGRFELADGGTLFLDEVGEIPLGLQAKLLRVLQEQQFERVGEERTRRVNVRIVAATNKDLQKEVEAGRFRQDLFYRLSAFPIEAPPLRERREDIPLLAAYFLEAAVRKMNLKPARLPQAQVEYLGNYQWPGNVRELQNVIERAAILAQGRPLNFETLWSPQEAVGAPIVSSPSSDVPALLTRADLKLRERQNILNALAQTKGKVYGPGGAAELLDMKLSTLASRMKVLGLKDRYAVSKSEFSKFHPSGSNRLDDAA